MQMNTQYPTILAILWKPLLHLQQQKDSFP